MHDILEFMQKGPGPTGSTTTRKLTFLHGLRLHGELHSAVLPRTKWCTGSTPCWDQDARRCVAENWPTCACSTPSCTPTRARSCFSWEASSASGPSGTSSRGSVGTFWKKPEHQGHAGKRWQSPEPRPTGKTRPCTCMTSPGDGFEWIELNDNQRSILALRAKGDRQTETSACVSFNFTPVPRGENTGWGSRRKGSYQEILKHRRPTALGGSGRDQTRDTREGGNRSPGRVASTQSPCACPPLGAVYLKNAEVDQI